MTKHEILPGYKEGELIQELNTIGGASHKKGALVRFKKDGDEFHYLNQNNAGLVRSKGNYIKQ